MIISVNIIRNFSKILMTNISIKRNVRFTYLEKVYDKISQYLEKNCFENKRFREKFENLYVLAKKASTEQRDWFVPLTKACDSKHEYLWSGTLNVCHFHHQLLFLQESITQLIEISMYISWILYPWILFCYVYFVKIKVKIKKDKKKSFKELLYPKTSSELV